MAHKGRKWRTADTPTAPAAVSAAREALLPRLQRALDRAQRDRRHGEAEAINGVIVALSDARHKANQTRAAVGPDVAALFGELEAL